MKILVVGSGGREHAICWKLAQSKCVDKIYAAPGNGGTAREAKCENIPLKNSPDTKAGIAELLEIALKLKPDLTIIGPEAPLDAGIADTFREKGLLVVGPGAAAAKLETSKVFSKDFMDKYGVRTGHSKVFTDAKAALHYIEGYKSLPIVVKADGLAAGKGVVVALSLDEAKNAIVSFMEDKSLGEAGNKILIEEFLEGKEVSVLAAVSVNAADKSGVILPFVSARDHKARFDGGKGPNTGGMGAISPVPDYTSDFQQDFEGHILKPTLRGLIAEGLSYQGFIFFGLMISKDKTYLLEYNARLGDPETQAVLPLMQNDFAELCIAITGGNENKAKEGLPTVPPLANYRLQWKTGAVCAPCLVADGYPGPYQKGDVINIDQAALKESNAHIFYAGAVLDNTDKPESASLITNGGRVLAVSAWGENPAIAREKAYKGIQAVSFKGKGFRMDIGV